VSIDSMFTVDEFYRQIGNHRLVAAKCKECASISLPPRPTCPKCLSQLMEPIELKGDGTLVSYTIIHIAPKFFSSRSPYPVGIVKLTEGPQLPGIIEGVREEDLRIGMRLTIGYSDERSGGWSNWPRYFFKPH
jgi:uncharacterized OB-fold protein